MLQPVHYIQAQVINLMHCMHCIHAKLVYHFWVYLTKKKLKKRDLFRDPLKKSYAGLRGVWIAGRILYAGKLLILKYLCLTTEVLM